MSSPPPTGRPFVVTSAWARRVAHQVPAIMQAGLNRLLTFPDSAVAQYINIGTKGEGDLMGEDDGEDFDFDNNHDQ